MKSVIAAIGALALAAFAAQAAPFGVAERHAAPQAANHQTYEAATARRQSRERFEPKDWATNRGAGTSRSNDANDG